MPQASLLICLSPRILTCLLFGSVTGEDCHKMTATILSTKTLHNPDSFPRSLPALSSLQASSLHTKTPCYIKTQPWMVVTQPGELLQQRYWVIKGVPPHPKKKVTLLSQGMIRDHRRILQSGITKKTGKECAPRQARPDRWHHSGAGDGGGRVEELRLCDGCPQVAELHRGTAMHGK